MVPRYWIQGVLNLKIAYALPNGCGKWSLIDSHRDTLDETSLTPGLRLERLKLDKEGFIELAVQREVDARLDALTGRRGGAHAEMGVVL